MENKIKWYTENIRNAYRIKDIFNLIGVLNMFIIFITSILFTSFTESASNKITLFVFITWLVSLLIYGGCLYMVFKCEARIKEWTHKKTKLVILLKAGDLYEKKTNH